MSTSEPISMVISSEALRLKLFLLAHKLPLNQSIHGIEGTVSAAAEDRLAKNILVDTLQSAMHAARNPSMAVDFGASIRPVDMGIYGMVIMTAPTVLDALQRSVKFSRLMTDSGQVYLEQSSSCVKWVWRSTEQLTLGARVRNEVVLTEHVAVVRALVARAMPSRVLIMHGEPIDTTRHREFFGCAISWSADEYSVEWPLDIAKISLNFDSSFGSFLEKEATRRLHLLPARDLVSAVRDAIARQFPSGHLNVSIIATSLGRTPRSLRRELSEAGHVYRSLVDNVRRERALELAGDTRHSMKVVALKLGFSESSAFSRAWRRWFNAPFRAKNKRII
jgi:AraC-like DNA-binding protein